MRQTPSLGGMRHRAECIIDVLHKARIHLRNIDVARKTGLAPDRVRRCMFRLEEAAVVEAHDEPGMTTRWRLANRVIACPDCKAPMDRHHVAWPVEGPRWVCPPAPKKRRGKR